MFCVLTCVGAAPGLALRVPWSGVGVQGRRSLLSRADELRVLCGQQGVLSVSSQQFSSLAREHLYTCLSSVVLP